MWWLLAAIIQEQHLSWWLHIAIEIQNFLYMYDFINIIILA